MPAGALFPGGVWPPPRSWWRRERPFPGAGSDRNATPPRAWRQALNQRAPGFFRDLRTSSPPATAHARAPDSPGDASQPRGHNPPHKQATLPGQGPLTRHQVLPGDREGIRPLRSHRTLCPPQRCHQSPRHSWHREGTPLAASIPPLGIQRMYPLIRAPGLRLCPLPSNIWGGGRATQPYRPSATTSWEKRKAPLAPTGGGGTAAQRQQTGSLGTPLPHPSLRGGDSSSALASRAWHWGGAKYLLATGGSCSRARETAPDSDCILHLGKTPAPSFIHSFIHSSNRY